jgi:hypothetical protein
MCTHFADLFATSELSLPDELLNLFDNTIITLERTFPFAPFLLSRKFMIQYLVLVLQKPWVGWVYWPFLSEILDPC